MYQPRPAFLDVRHANSTRVGAHAWADYDNDGYVDIVTEGHVQNLTNSISQVWHNNGDGTFTNIAASAGVQSQSHRNRGSGAVDYDNDSFVDIFATAFHRPAGGAPNNLYRNNGDLTFTDVAALAGLDRPDIDRDVDLGQLSCLT
jgi:hypothetical protein